MYVGIFAYRYGYIEPGHDKSLTEIEFDHAGERNIDRLCFTMDPNHPWPHNADDPEHHVQLGAFKQRVNLLIRGQFTTEDDLKVKLMQALDPYKA